MNQKGLVKTAIILVIVATVAIGGYSTFIKNNFGFNVSRVGTDVSHKISTGELSVVEELFQKNKISLDNLQIIKVSTSEDLNKVKTFHIVSNILYHRLQIFPSQIIYHIKETGELDSINGSAPKDINIQTNPKIMMSEAVNIVRTKMAGSKYTAELIVFIKNPDRGVRIYEIGADGGSKPTGFKDYPPDSFILAWEIHSDNRQLPSEVAWVNASTGELIRYFSGVVN